MFGSRRAALMFLLTPLALALLITLLTTQNRKPNRRKKLSRLRRSILGSGKRRITSLLGPPRVTQTGQSSTWYYPLSEADRIAVAISFHKGLARRVDFIRSPLHQLR